MNLVPYSWNGYAINDFVWNGTGLGEWSGSFPVGQRANLTATGVFSPVAYDYPDLSVTQLSENYITLEFHPKSLTAGHTISYMREQLKGWFNPRDLTQHQLIAQDAESANKQWYLLGLPIGFTQTNIDTFLVTLALNDPIWRSVTASTTGNVTVNTTPKTHTLTVLGNTAARPVLTFTPTGARTGSYAYKRYVPIYNTTAYAFPFAVSSVDITGGGLNTAALVAGGKMLASGNDCRVMVDGIDSNRWFGGGGINSTTTTIWANIPYMIGKVGVLSGNLANSGTDVTVTIKKTTAGTAFIKKLAIAANAAFIIGSEIFTYTKSNVDLTNYKITLCKRAQKTTSFAAHSDGDNVTWIQHDIWLMYGNASAAAPVIDDTKKPLLDLTNSTNASWVWTIFRDTVSTRPGAWTPAVVSSQSNRIASSGGFSPVTYITTGDMAVSPPFANPATDLGMLMQSGLPNTATGAPTVEIAELCWSFYHPAGFTTTSMATKRYVQFANNWPAVAGLYKSLDNKNWTVVWNETKPAAASYTANTHNGVALGATYQYLKLWFKGTLAAIAGDLAALQGDTVTLALGAGRLTVSLLAEQNNYQLTSNVANTTSGESFDLNCLMALNQTLIIDCAAKTVTLSDGTNMFNALTLSPGRTNTDWLNVGVDTNGKFTGAAAIVITETGIGTETQNISWNDMSY